jgi:hypothetical protein
VAEFFSALILLFVAYLWGSLFYSVRRNKDRNKLLYSRPPIQTTKITEQKPMMVVKRSVNDMIGTYDDNKIYRYVQLDDGRNFIFESIAVEKSPGVYHADSSDNYIIVDKCLLYREVKIG